MKKARYLQTLKESLNGKLPEHELLDIISDYEGFFLTGMEEGKTEEEISAELGDPIEIAHSLVESEEKMPSIHYAPVYKRIPALIIDIIVAGLPFVWFAPYTSVGLYFRPDILSNMIPSLLSTVSGSSHQWISHFKYFWLAGIIAACLWFFLVNPLCMLLFKGYTLGKKIMGIRVVSVDGKDAKFIQIIVREWIGKYFINMLGSMLPSILELLSTMVSLIWASLPRNHNTIHDIIARTCVIDCDSQREEKRKL